MTAVFPLSDGGAAAECARLLTDSKAVRLRDLTAVPRFGLKGPGADAWFGARVALPEVNQWAPERGLALLRLGHRDIMALADPDAPDVVTTLRKSWEDNPQGYSSWREETWAWLRLDGPATMQVAARLTAFDLRPASFGAHAVAQTRFAHLDTALLRAGEGLDILFDIAATAQVVGDIHAAINRHEVFG